jgi:hypothetical protein
VCAGVSEDEQYDCHFEIAESLKDASMCSNIDSAGKREKCFYDIAKKFPGARVCENIQDQEDKNYCEKYDQ